VARGAFLGHLFAPVDIASVVFFRIAFGAIMVWEVWRYFSHGWIQRDYIDPIYHFSYYGFEWVQPWSGNGMYLHFLALGVLAACIIIGLWYRVSTVLFFLGYTYVFLLDQALYMNHFYLIALISFLLIFTPAHRSFSVDALWRPQIRSETVPAWTLWMLAAQMGIVYFYGGLAKLNGDWLRGEPMRSFLGSNTDFPIIGRLFTEGWMVYLFSYGGLLFDLLIVPFLLWRRTRLVAFAFAIAFHLTNAQLFNIGIFPWFAIAASTLYFAPSWPRRFVAFLRNFRWSPRWTAVQLDHEEQEMREEDAPAAPTPLKARHWVIISLLGVFFAVQLLVPLRHFLYPGDASWTYEGHRFAWRMMLRDAAPGVALFHVTDRKSDRRWDVDPRSYLTTRQMMQLVNNPDMNLQFSHMIAEERRAKGHEEIEIRATVLSSLHKRDYQNLIDPTVDLAKQPRTLATASWIVPLEEPLPPLPS
jgi:vitamin K-dependent gamma-carboxylase